MRLRLNVQRHGLPPSLVVWTTGDRNPTGCSPNSTVSQLLEKVNDVIPLESDDWGLEDYVIEINGYECLHFQELGSVFKDDDEVCIRPLLSPDLRARKLSGRHQISHAGRHLIDGVPFGRPFFKRAADRPAVEIPPRKRRRLTNDGDGELNDTEAGRQLTHQSSFADIGLEDDDDGDEEDFNVDDDSDDSIFGGNGSDASSYSPSHSRRYEVRATKSGDRKPELILSNGQSLPLVDRDGKPFPGYYNNALLDCFADGKLGAQTPTIKGVGGAQERNCDPGLGRTERGVSKERSSIRRPSFPLGSRSLLQSEKNVRFQDTKGSTLDDGSSDEGLHPDDSSDGIELDAQDGTASGCSESSSETDSDTSYQTSSSSSNGPTESEPEEISSRPSLRSPSKKPHTTGVTSHSVAPGAGQISTKRRNQRRRDAKKLAHLKRTGQLPQHATHADLREWVRGTLCVDPAKDTSGPRTDPRTFPAAVSLEAKREELLASITSGGVEVEQLEKQPNAQEIPTKTAGQGRGRERDVSPPSTALTNDTTPRTRAKLDIVSSRRMLFSSLGLKNPKTKEDEERLRLDLTKPLSNGQQNRKCVNPSGDTLVQDQTAITPVKRINATDVPEDHADEEGDGWKDKITLKAVECCYDGIELSMPPFPFRQRWDPQQQVYPKRGRGKKRKRSRIQYYNDGDEYYSTLGEGSKPRGLEEDVQLEYDEHQGGGHTRDPSGGTNIDGVDGSLNEQIIRETHGTDGASAGTKGDLPVLPADMSSLANFTLSMAQPGAIIAFKQLTISEDWQPHICDYRTAEVVRLTGENALELSLARRDIPARGRKFDEKTGERIWGKFEMPDVDEEGDSGSLRLDFSELIVPKLIRQPHTANPTNTEGVMDEIVGEVDPCLSHLGPKEADNERSAVGEEISWIYRPLNALLGSTRSGGSAASAIGVQGDGEVGGRQSPSQPLDSVRESNDTLGEAKRVEGHQSSSASASSASASGRQSPGQVDVGTERVSEGGHDISQLIRDAGFRSTVVSLLLSSPPAQGRATPDGQTVRKILEDAASQAPTSSPVRSPRFNGLSSSPVPEEQGLIEPTGASSPDLEPTSPFSVSEQSPLYGNAEQFDPTIASVGYPKLPGIATSPRQPVDSDNCLIGGRSPDCQNFISGGRHPNPDALTAEHQGESQSLSEALPGEEGMPEDGASTSDVGSPLAGENAIEEPPNADSSSSEKDYPSFQELIASGRPPVQQVKEEFGAPRLMAEEDSASNAMATNIRNKMPMIIMGSQSPGGLQLSIGPQTSSITDLTASSPTGGEKDEDEDDVGLPLGPGWVQKRKTTLGDTNDAGRRKRRPRDIYSLK
ncbi:MAG: hypothetical protein M1839_008819 [Geoglossum umbratile]|nr:MAG: hypothetical protein M1839_008819 [Geoglossum umbratile]